LILILIDTTLGWNYPSAARLLVRLDALTNIAVTAVTADQQRFFRHDLALLYTHANMVEQPRIDISTL
jgi:hypothetical protein